MVIFVTRYPNISVLTAAYKAGGRRQISDRPPRALKSPLDELAVAATLLATVSMYGLCSVVQIPMKSWWLAFKAL